MLFRSIKGFYLAVATLAAQFFFEWLFGRVQWFYNYNDSGAIEVPVRKFFNIIVTGPTATTQAQLKMGNRMVQEYMILQVATNI